MLHYICNACNITQYVIFAHAIGRSAVVDGVGADCLTASDFMKLLGADKTASGPTDKQQYNALLLVVEPKDVLASTVFRVASATQVQGLQGFMNASVVLCIPHICPC